MKILITGGAGFIGSNLAEALLNKGHKVAIIDDLSTGKKENVPEEAVFYNVDILSSEILEVLRKEEPEVVFHLAAQIDLRKAVENPSKDAQINILGSLNLIQKLIEVNPSAKFIFASTGGAIYGDAEIIPTPESYPEWPLSPYGICKLAVEKYLEYYRQVFGLNYVSLRYANVYGPKQDSKGEAGVVAIFIDKMLNGEQPVIYGDGEQTRDFVFVDDVVNANLLAMEKDFSSEDKRIFNIGTTEETKINTIFNKLKNLTQSNCEEIHKSPREGEQQRSCLDYSRARETLGWNPEYSLEKGLKKTVNWFNS